MPEMQAVWQAVTSEVSDHKTVHTNPSIQAPTERARFLRVEAISHDDKEKIPPIFHSLIPKHFNDERKKAIVLRRSSKSTKRYLVFCQLKTEG
jgi:hypothetical protein